MEILPARISASSSAAVLTRYSILVTCVALRRAMNSRERWVVHNALSDEKGVRSESEGEGRMRRVKLVPA